MCSTYCGLVVGSGVGGLTTIIFNSDQMYSFAWRIPFLLSFFLGILALILRMKCEESPMYSRIVLQKEILKSPFKDVFKFHLEKMITICFLSSALAVSIYLIIGYLPTFFISTVKLSLKSSMLVSFIGLTVLTALVPIMGLLSDKFNRKNVLALGTIGLILFAYPIFLFASIKSIYFSILSEGLIAFFLAPIAGSLIAILSEIFPTNVRYTGVSIGYNISMALFGGTTPLIAIYLTDLLKNSTAPAYWLILCGGITLLSLIKVKTNRNNMLI